MMITIKNLHLTYHGRNSFHALKGVSLELRRNEFLTLLGPSGCGKTTLLRSIAGLEVPDSGSIAIDGKDVFNAAEGIEIPTARRNLGMVFQSYAIWPHMSVFENAAFPLRYRRREMTRIRMRERTLECLEMVRLADLADRPAPMLSGGQQQRLAVARALCADPKVLLLDEPLSNLDARLREDMRFELREITRRSGVTTVFVTHEQTEALSMSDRVVVMNKGEVVELGTPRDLYLDPRSAFVAAFLGRSNLLPAEIVAVDTAPAETVTVTSAIGRVRGRMHGVAKVGDRVTLVVRPDSICIDDVAQSGSDKPVATVDGIAFLGDSVDCALRLADVSLIAKVSSNAAPQLGANVAVSVKPNEALVLSA
jgi:iron(III) transport system ATP-binding protein